MKLRVIWAGKISTADKRAIKKTLEARVGAEGLTGELEVGVSFVGRDEMVGLNQKHMGRVGATDVLSFPLEKEIGPDKVIRLGDIVICPAEAKGQSHTFLAEHGMLHLLGKHHD